MGFNGIMSGIHEFIKEQLSKQRVAYLWNNVSKLSAIGKKHMCQSFKLERKVFPCNPKGN